MVGLVLGGRDESDLAVQAPVVVPVDVLSDVPAYRCGKRSIRIKIEDLEAAPHQIPNARW